MKCMFFFLVFFEYNLFLDDIMIETRHVVVVENACSNFCVREGVQVCPAYIYQFLFIIF